MLYITGDTHGEPARFFEPKMPCRGWTRADMLIVAGDFGCVFTGDDGDGRRLELLARLPYTILFIDGNHENFPAIHAFPEERWRGGRIHRLRENVIHLMRGQVFELEGNRIFTMGGGYSLDRAMRAPGRSWWPEELPSEAEYAEARRNLAACGNRVDFIVSHVAPLATMEALIRAKVFSANFPQERKLQAFLDEVDAATGYPPHYFGHIHMDSKLWRNQTALFRAIYRLDTGERIG